MSPTITRVLMLSVLVLFSAALDAKSAPELRFEAIRAVMPPSPIWLPATGVLEPDGKMKAGLFDAQSERSLSRIIYESGIQTQSASGYARPCPAGYMARNYERADPRPNDSIESLSLHARGIYSGQIIAILPGFVFGEPGSLLQLRVGSSLRASPAIGPTPDLFVFYPFMNTRVADKLLCRADERFPFRPRVGDSALVFVYDLPLDKRGTLVTPKYHEIALQHPGEPLHAPPGIRADLQRRGVTDLAALESEVQTMIESRESSPRPFPPERRDDND